MRKNKTFKTVLILFALLIYIGGAALIVVPYFKTEFQDKNAKSAAQEFVAENEQLRQQYQIAVSNGTQGNFDITEKPDYQLIEHGQLLEDMQAYNENIYRNLQGGLVDAWSYTASHFDLSSYGLASEIVGTLEIPKIGTFPVYLGASKEHMENGVAQLTETSMPIGGINTNCVIAGHRGWHNGKYLKDIEEVAVGDVLTLTNLWYEMKYQVTEIKIIMPNDIDQILIQPGKDLLTVVTCHPYGSGGRYRYLLICERIDKGTAVTETPTTSTTSTDETGQVTETETSQSDNSLIKLEEIPYFSSKNNILLDDILHYIGFGAIVIIPVIAFAVMVKPKKKK